MVRYGKEQRDGAVGLYIRYERCAVDVIHELGYPDRGCCRCSPGPRRRT